MVSYKVIPIFVFFNEGFYQPFYTVIMQKMIFILYLSVKVLWDSMLPRLSIISFIILIPF